MTPRPVARLLPLTALIAAATAAASVVVGNPTASVALDSGGTVAVGDLRAYTCPGYQDFAVDAFVTVEDPASVELDVGTWCAVQLQVWWNGASSWDVVTVDGFDELVTTSSGAARTIHLDPTGQTATLE